MRLNRRSVVLIVVITIILLASSFLEIVLVFRLTTRQTVQYGQNRLASIGGQLTSTIGAAKLHAQQISLKAEPLLNDRKKLEQYICEEKKNLKKETDGICFNCYIAGRDWQITPDFEKPADLDLTERSWYVGAIRSDGMPFVTAPYVDVMTGDICFTVSVMLPDGETVCAVDYTMDSIQKHIEQMDNEHANQAIIVTADGVIAGCSDQSKIGMNLVQGMPEYAGIFSLAKNGSGEVSYRHNGENLFAARSNSGWILIVSEESWSLFKISYIQIISMLLISLVIFGIVLVLYFISLYNARKAEEAYTYKEKFLEQITSELQEPLQRILNTSSPEYVEHASEPELAFGAIHAAGTKLSDKIDKIISYSGIVRSKKEKKDSARRDDVKLSRQSRWGVIVSLAVVMCLSLYINVSATMSYGSGRMQGNVSSYQYQLDEWINTQKSIMDMFCSIISAHPEMLNDYEGTRRYLDDITQQYHEISVSYWVNEKFPYSVCMNNGWHPDADWHVEEREWYKETMASEEGWDISAPYYDKQTGLYCITFSKRVYDAKTGAFLGVFGIDFYMDKLVDILGSSYTGDSYAFLTDASGEILNHPYGKYQMTESGSTNVMELACGKADPDGKRVCFVRDYDDVTRAVIAVRNKRSHLTIYVASGLLRIYGNVLIYGVVTLLAMIVCIVLLYRLISRLFRLQENANRRIQESADAAIAADAAKTSFLAQMSHEIRTPINAVLGMNEMILRETADPGIRNYAVNIQSAGRTLLALINSILDFSKIEDGKMEIIPVEYDTASLLNDLVSSVMSRAKEKNLEFRVRIDSTLPSVLIGDDVRLRQIIANLLTNAVKYTEKGSVTFVMRQERRSEDKISLYVEVTDTGIGIREEDMSILFDSFRRLDETRNRNIEGTGLGMSIVNGLLGMMDSKLDVQSVYGKGSTFSFCIQQGIASAEPVGDYEKRFIEGMRQDEQETCLYAPDAKILVVDDNEMNLRVAVGLLRLCGIVPDTVDSGEKALGLVKQKTYDVILLDHMMPKMDGLETLNRMKAQDLLPETTSVIALTANAIVGAKEMYLQAGFDDYISKPIESRILEKRLAAHLPKEKLSTRPKAAPEPKEPEEETTEMDMFTIEEMQDIREKCPALNLMTGLNYCMDSKEFYLESLQIFIDADQRETIAGHYAAEDITNYRIAVHALKSAALTIGAVLLSDHAKALEMAAKANDTAFIRSHHDALMEEYTEVLEGIGKVVET